MPTIERWTENGLKECVLSRIIIQPSSKTAKSLGHDTCSSRPNIGGRAAWRDRSCVDRPSLSRLTCGVRLNRALVSSNVT